MTEQEIKKMLEDGGKAVTELRKKLEKQETTEAERKELLAKMETTLTNMENANKEVTKKMLEKEKESAEFKEKLLIMEKTLSRPVLSGKDRNEKTEEMKAFEKFITKGAASLTAEEVKYLRTDSAPEGGYLAPLEYTPEILKKITEISPMRSVCRVRKTSKGGIEIPNRTDLISGYWVGEGKPATASNSKYGMLKIVAHKMIALAEITTDALGDSAFNMESEINADIAETFAQMEGAAVLNGDNINKPEGILTASNTVVQEKISKLATSYTGDNLIEMCGMLKTGYKPIFGINRTELAFLRTLKDGQGRYLWTPGLGEGRPSTINGYPYMEMPDLDVQGAGKFPVIFGDFMRGYTIVDDVVMGFIRDNTTKADEGKVRFISYRKLGGKIVMGEAIVRLKCATA